MKQRLLLLFGVQFSLACVLFSADVTVAAEDVGGPLYVKNLSPVTSLLGLPSQRTANTQAVGSYSLTLHSSIASHYVAEAGVNEQVNLDGETVRLALEARVGLAEGWDLQIEVPWVSHSGGSLDSAIDSWHDLWGVSDGGRSNVERDILDFSYSDAVARFSLTDDTSGVGDISVSLSHDFYRDNNSTANVVAGYKFATGDEEKLLGSGEADAYLALRFSGGRLARLPLNWHGQVGYLYAGSSELLGPRQENNLWFAGISMDWVFTPQISLFAQLDMHAAPLNSELTALGEDAVLGSLGGRWRFASNWSLDISLIEDLLVETAPDVTFQASIRYGGG